MAKSSTHVWPKIMSETQRFQKPVTDPRKRRYIYTLYTWIYLLGFNGEYVHTIDASYGKRRFDANRFTMAGTRVRWKNRECFSVWGVQLTCEKGWLIPAWYFGIDIQQILGIEFVKQLKPTASWIFQLMCWMHDKFSSSMCQDHLCRYAYPIGSMGLVYLAYIYHQNQPFM